MEKEIKRKDRQFLWHPFTKINNQYDPIVISSAKNDILVDIKGNEYVDLISSWWVNIHGHCKKEIIESIRKQSEKLEQVLFADFTHEPAVNLAEKIVDLMLIAFTRAEDELAASNIDIKDFVKIKEKWGQILTELLEEQDKIIN